MNIILLKKLVNTGKYNKATTFFTMSDSVLSALKFIQLSTFLLACLLVFATLSHADMDPCPTEIGGFTLGEGLEGLEGVQSSSYLKEIIVTNHYGFRKGFLLLGTCKYKDKVLRIRLKYNDSSLTFFKELLKRYKKQYGEPDEWKGDSFGIVRIWKWFFTDDKGRKVSLSLQHNSHNSNENIGNLVKLTFSELLEEERECLNAAHKAKKADMSTEEIEAMKKPDWLYMIPR